MQEQIIKFKGEDYVRVSKASAKRYSKTMNVLLIPNLCNPEILGDECPYMFAYGDFHECVRQFERTFCNYKNGYISNAYVSKVELYSRFKDRW